MLPGQPEYRSDKAGERSFASTHWSMVLAAGRRSSPNYHEALAALCRTYWFPLYGFIRSQGFKPEDAQDLTQGFFAQLFDKDYLAKIEPARGKFRSFLLTAVKHFIANELDRARAQKRGGGEPCCRWTSSPLRVDYSASPLMRKRRKSSSPGVGPSPCSTRFYPGYATSSKPRTRLGSSSG